MPACVCPVLEPLPGLLPLRSPNSSSATNSRAEPWASNDPCQTLPSPALMPTSSSHHSPIKPTSTWSFVALKQPHTPSPAPCLPHTLLYPRSSVALPHISPVPGDADGERGLRETGDSAAAK